MRKETLYRWLTLVTPIFGVLCVAGVSIYEWQRLKRLEAETATTQAKLRQISDQLRDFEAQPTTEKYPTAAKSPREQAMFLDSLRANADACKVQLIRWSNTTPAPAAPAQGGADKNASALPAGVATIVSIVEVAGRSENTRRFLYNVVRSRRLLNMSDIKWVRDSWPNTHLTFTLTRYVAPPVQLPASRARSEHAHADGNNASPPSLSAAGFSAVPVGANQRETHADQRSGVPLPNPMDAPGIAHGAYQSRLEAGVSQLSELDRDRSTASPKSPAVSDAKH